MSLPSVPQAEDDLHLPDVPAEKLPGMSQEHNNGIFQFFMNINTVRIH